MANQITRIEKWLPNVVDTVFAVESKTALLENGKKFLDLDFKEAGYVRVMSILMDGLSDYYRVNHIGQANSEAYAHNNENNGIGARDGYHRGSTSATWQIYQLAYDRGKQFLVDNMDNEETAGGIIANLLKEFLRTKVVPEVDALRFSKIAGTTNASLGNRVVESVASLQNTILNKFNGAFEWLTEHEVPEEEQIIFVSPAVYTAIMSSTELTRYITQADFRSESGITFKLQSYAGRPIVVVPSDRFYDSIVISQNGYYPSANSKVINYIVCSKKAIIPIVKLNKSKVWSPETQDDFDGYKVNFRMYHDVIVPENKVAGVYVSLSDTTASTKASKLDVLLKKATGTHDYILENYYTLPAGMLGKVVFGESAFVLGQKAILSGASKNATIVEKGATFTVGTTTVESTTTENDTYFALIDGADNIIASSGATATTMPE